ncbi:MAG: glycosyltransferase family 2 protein [Candidatus Brennerbacteria bacterium]
MKIDVIILTRNEELNLSSCLQSIKLLGAKTWVVDSGSVDKTSDVAKTGGAEFVVHKEYMHQAQQFNWALDHLPLRGEWILRLDADEWLTPELIEEIKKRLTSEPQDVSGFYLKRRVYFMGRWIRHGGYYPTWMLRLFRRGKARCEEREMDEHIAVSEGRVERMRYDFVDENRKGLAAWTEKHNDFSTREARARSAETQSETILGGQAGRKRWFKQNFYGRLPLFCRAFIYFCYRYFFRLGFLDGIPGLIFHFLQGFWHQFLTDAKEYEMRGNPNYKGHERRS